MITIHANKALLPDGWASNLSISIDDEGYINSVDRDANQLAGHSVGILLPAPVNVHSHSFQRAMAGLTEHKSSQSADSFWTWRQLMFRFLDQLSPEHVEAITTFVQMEMLKAGYATNVEFHYLHHQPGGIPYANEAELSLRVAAASMVSGIGLTLLPVHYQYGGCDKRALTAGQIRFGNDIDRFRNIFEVTEKNLPLLFSDANLGLAPHSLRAVDPEHLNDLINLANGRPIHMHLAEQKAEVDEVLASWGNRPVEWVLENVPVDEHWCMIHCTQMLAHETEGLAKSGVVAGLCPLTESSLGDGIFDGLSWFNHAGKIAIGSDSNIRISLSEELRTLEYSQRLRDRSRAALATDRKSTARRIFDELLIGGAQASKRKTGRIESGYWADLMTLDGEHIDLEERNGDDLLDCFVFAGDDNMILDVWSAGRHMVRGGNHVNSEEIIKNYRFAMQELRDAI